MCAEVIVNTLCVCVCVLSMISGTTNLFIHQRRAFNTWMKSYVKGKDFDVKVHVCEDIFFIGKLVDSQSYFGYSCHHYITSPVEISMHKFLVEICMTLRKLSLR